MADNFTSPYKVKTKAYNSQARKLILNVLCFIQSSKRNPDLLQGTPTEVAARALNINPSTITNIKKTGVSTPTKRPGRTPKVFFDDFDKVPIKNIIQQLYKSR